MEKCAQKKRNKRHRYKSREREGGTSKEASVHSFVLSYSHCETHIRNCWEKRRGERGREGGLQLDAITEIRKKMIDWYRVRWDYCSGNSLALTTEKRGYANKAAIGTQYCSGRPLSTYYNNGDGWGIRYQSIPGGDGIPTLRYSRRRILPSFRPSPVPRTPCGDRSCSRRESEVRWVERRECPRGASGIDRNWF